MGIWRFEDFENTKFRGCREVGLGDCRGFGVGDWDWDLVARSFGIWRLGDYGISRFGAYEISQLWNLNFKYNLEFFNAFFIFFNFFGIFSNFSNFSKITFNGLIVLDDYWNSSYLRYFNFQKNFIKKLEKVQNNTRNIKKKFLRNFKNMQILKNFKISRNFRKIANVGKFWKKFDKIINTTNS